MCNEDYVCHNAGTVKSDTLMLPSLPALSHRHHLRAVKLTLASCLVPVRHYPGNLRVNCLGASWVCSRWRQQVCDGIAIFAALSVSAVTPTAYSVSLIRLLVLALLFLESYSNMITYILYPRATCGFYHSFT